MFEYRLFQDTNILTTRSRFQDVQRKYFELLDREFHDILKDAEGSASSVGEIIDMLATKETNVIIFHERKAHITENIRKFWGDNGLYVYSYLKGLKSLKTYHYQQILQTLRINTLSQVVTRSSLYIDTIVIADPLQVVLGQPDVDYVKANAPTSGFLAAIYCLLYIKQLRPLVLAQTDAPIVAIAPFAFDLSPEFLSDMTTLTMLEHVIHFGKMFGVNTPRSMKGLPFVSQQALENDVARLAKELHSFIPQITDAWSLSNFLVDRTRLLIDEDGQHLSVEQLFNRERENIHYLNEVCKVKPDFGPIDLLIAKMQDNLKTINYVVASSADLYSVPLITGRVDWQYLLWKYEYDKELFYNTTPMSHSKDMVIVSALQDKEITWLGDVPMDTIIEWREQGRYETMREIIRKGFNDIEEAAEDDYPEAVNQISHNLADAFEKHKNELHNVSSTALKSMGGDLAAAAVVGTINIAALKTGINVLDVFKELVGLAALAKLFGDGCRFHKERRRLKSAPIGILMDVKKRIHV